MWRSPPQSPVEETVVAVLEDHEERIAAPLPIDTGAAGLSAKREFERRCVRRAERVRAALPPADGGCVAR